MKLSFLALVLATAVAAGAPDVSAPETGAARPAGAQRFVYQGKELHLGPRSVSDSLRTIALEDLPSPAPACRVRLQGSVTPFTARLWLIALRDVESNIVDRPDARFFGAGAVYKERVFTRDMSFSGILGLNELYPDMILSSLKFTRKEIFEAGFKVPSSYAVPEVAVPWERTDSESDPTGTGAGNPEVPALLLKYPIGPYTRRTDDVVWLWCADDLLSRSAQPDWAWLYGDGERCFDRFYRYFFDPSDGLYRGQAAFVDIHYPDRLASGYPHDWTIGDCIAAKALSTNCLYVFGLEAMAHAAERLGKKSEAEAWRARAVALRAAIRRGLRRPDGTFAYLKDRHGALQPRREALGSALAVLSGVVAGGEARAALRNYPVTEKGVPLFDPFFPFAQTYHNNTAWPFVDTFFLWAKETADGSNLTALNAALLARTCTKEDRGFREEVNWRTGEPSGSSRQLWSAAAFINVCRRAGLLAKKSITMNPSDAAGRP